MQPMSQPECHRPFSRYTILSLYDKKFSLLNEHNGFSVPDL